MLHELFDVLDATVRVVCHDDEGLNDIKQSLQPKHAARQSESLANSRQRP